MTTKDKAETLHDLEVKEMNPYESPQHLDPRDVSLGVGLWRRFGRFEVISVGWLAVSLVLAITTDRLCMSYQSDAGTARVPSAFEIDMARLLLAAFALGILGTLLLVPVCLLRGVIQLVQGRLTAAATTGFVCLASLATFLLIAWVAPYFFVI